MTIAIDGTLYHDYSKRALCADCGTDTTPCRWEHIPLVKRLIPWRVWRTNGRCLPGCDHDGRWEWYGVHDTVWAEAHAERHLILCIGCLETRLGRQLRPGDFSGYDVNDQNWWDTLRLANRKGHD